EPGRDAIQVRGGVQREVRESLRRRGTRLLGRRDRAAGDPAASHPRTERALQETPDAAPEEARPDPALSGRSPVKPVRIQKVLIANRGEIAIRICRTLREMKIGSVAIFSEADQDAPHVFAADEAHPVGPAPAAQSYLNASRVLDVARRAGADAVHPGYGFLSESAAFAEQVLAAGLVWIGPTPAAIRSLGDKLSARALAIEAKVPVLPGTEQPTGDPDELRRQADT